MKSKIITTIILEGVDGVGKDTIANIMRKKWDRHYGIYVRGELSDYVYAKKYNRQFISTQRGLPFIYILLTANKSTIKKRILNRNIDLDDINKIDDQDEFIEAAKEFSLDYHILTLDTTYVNPDVMSDIIFNAVDDYAQSIEADEAINEYNKMYDTGCNKLGLKFYVKNNQPYINDKTLMADAQLHNGYYETFNDKTMPHNFIFSLGYTKEVEKNYGEYDFCYIIGSKINVRPEIKQYYDIFKSHNLSCITRDTFNDKVFGDEYLERIAKAKATIYCCRDLEYLKMITVRPYEAALAKQILFVDTLSDKNNEILQQIHGENSILSKLLYVTPKTIYIAYKSLSQEQIKLIIDNQLKWYYNLKEKIYKQFRR